MEGRAWLAWHIGALSGTNPKKFPKAPSALLPRSKAQGNTSWRAMDADAMSWVVNSGGAILPG
jgi:hypothetical protein